MLTLAFKFSTTNNKQNKKLPVQKLDLKNPREIPEILRFIWFGGEIPNTDEHPYLYNLKNAAKLYNDAGYNIELCISGKYYAAGDTDKINKLKIFCKKHYIEIIDIDAEEHQNLPNIELAYKLLELKNWAAAADVLKVALTVTRGGYTIDFDLIPKKIIEKQAKYGILLDCGDNTSKPEVSPRFHFLAACPQHELFFILCKLHQYILEYIFKNYETSGVARDTYWTWKRKNSHMNYHEITTTITGRLIPKAVRILEQIDPAWNKIMNNLENIFLDLHKYFEMTKKHFWTCKLPKENYSPNLFRITINLSSTFEKIIENNFLKNNPLSELRLLQ